MQKVVDALIVRGGQPIESIVNYTKLSMEEVQPHSPHFSPVLIFSAWLLSGRQSIDGVDAARHCAGHTGGGGGNLRLLFSPPLLFAARCSLLPARRWFLCDASTCV
jgi:hypothetical protein